MTTELLENLERLARRAVACKHWKWLGGMRVVSPPEHYGATGYTFRVESDGYVAKAGDYPDFTDPATIGCLLALVREAWGDGVYLLPDGGWYVKGARLKNGYSISLGICADTEAAALVAALEAAK